MAVQHLKTAEFDAVVEAAPLAMVDKAVVLLMGAAGVANMWEAVFADVGVSVIAILNAMRALRTK